MNWANDDPEGYERVLRTAVSEWVVRDLAGVEQARECVHGVVAALMEDPEMKQVLMARALPYIPAIEAEYIVSKQAPHD